MIEPRTSLAVVLVALSAGVGLFSGGEHGVTASGRLLAVRRDPANPARWSEWGQAFAAKGDREKAAACHARAVQLAPNSPPVLLEAARFYFETRNIPPALRFCSHVLELARDYDQEIFNLYTRANLSAESILAQGIPLHRQAAQAWLRYILDFRSANMASLTWSWLASHAFTDDQLAAEYTTYLLESHQYYAASQAWSQYLGVRGRDYLRSNLLYNGDFETEITGSPLDWSPSRIPHVQENRDNRVAHSGKSSYRVSFDGAANLNYHGLSQPAVVIPGYYEFEAWGKTSGITTDQGIAIRISDLESAQRLDVQTIPLSGDADWRKLELSFFVPPATRIVKVELVRHPSFRFNNRIAGSLWIDSVRLWNTHPVLPQKPGHAQHGIEKVEPPR